MARKGLILAIGRVRLKPHSKQEESVKENGTIRLSRVSDRHGKPHGLRRAGSRGVRNLTGWVGSGQEVFKYHGSGRVRSILFVC